MTARPSQRLRLLSAGAARGVVEALAGTYEAATGVALEATFDAAGTIRDRFLRDVACDLVILPATMQAELAADGRVDPASVRPLGAVPTGIAIAHGDRRPLLAAADDLRKCLHGASALYCPDTIRSTAGLHFAGVLRALGLFESSAAKLRTYPNGARAMAALASLGAQGAIGCTQVTEILHTPGVVLVAPLPAPFELTTVYAIAVSRNADNAPDAHAFAAHLVGRETRALRRSGGFLDAST